MNRTKSPVGSSAFLVLGSSVIALLLFPRCSAGNEWPTVGHNGARSCVSPEQLQLPLQPAWVHQPRHVPRPAWPEPAKQDIWHEHKGLRPELDYDRAFRVVAADGAVFFGSSADDKVYCLDAATGSRRWSFFTEGPVRFAPAIVDGQVYLGSDDGCVYCLSAADGKLLWRRRVAPDDRRVPGNGRMISVWPIRTGVLVDGEVAYCGAGLFPNDGVYLSALNTKDGNVIWQVKTDWSLQGYLTASKTQLFAPTGRTPPVVFDRRDGKYVGAMPGEGGTFALLGDDVLVSGPGRKTGHVSVSDPQTRQEIVTFRGLHIIVDEGTAYLQTKTSIRAFDRVTYLALVRKKKSLVAKTQDIQKRIAKAQGTDQDEQRQTLQRQLDETKKQTAGTVESMRKCFPWEQPSSHSYSLVLSGDVLFAGGDGQVAAFGTTDGKELWTAAVAGRAYGLAVAGGRLFVSTDRGSIHCFSPDSDPRPTIRPAPTVPYPEDDLTALYRRAARRIIERSGVKQGYCLDLGCGEGRLAYEIARLTDMQIIGVEEDPQKAAAARTALDRAGVYGVKITVQQGSLSELPYTGYFANLIVSDRTVISGELPGNSKEVFRVLRPCGGVACLGSPAGPGELARSEIERWFGGSSHKTWEVEEGDGLWLTARRGPLPGAGQWTHLYADPGNSASSGDRLAAPLEIQWFGKPGPRHMVDRHHRAPGPLSIDGRLFVPGDNRVLAVDAYNGTVLWDLELPTSRRVGASKDSGNVVATSDYVYITAEDRCVGIDVETGSPSLEFQVPQPAEGSRRVWGYVASVDRFLFGSGAEEHASRTELGKSVVLDGIYYDQKPLVTSESLFCLDRLTGKRVWDYQRRDGSAIVNAAIAIGDGRVYFIESRNPEALADADGRITLDVLLAKGHAYLVGLDMETGQQIWEREPQIGDLRHVLFLVYSDSTLLVVGSRNQGDHPRYDLHAFDPENGEPVWSNHYLRKDKRTKGSHGEQDQHPVVIGGTIYSRPYAFDLKTGEKKTFDLARGGHGCGGITGSASYLYGRGGYPRMYPLGDGGSRNIPLTRTTRVGCWMNIVPAGGLVLVPESGSGCTCGYSMQTSMALAPRSPP